MLFDLKQGSGIWGTGMLPDTSLTGAPVSGTRNDASQLPTKTFGSGSLAGDPVKEDPEKAYERRLVNSMVSRNLPGSSRSLNQVVQENATRLGVNPDFVAGSFLGEGGNLIFDPNKPAYSDAYDYAVAKGQIDPKVYKTDAFFAAGMDDAQRDLDEAKAKGYLPKDMDYKHYEAINEAVQKKNIAETDKKGNVTKYIAPKELVDRWLKKDNTDEEWIKANDDMRAYLKEKKVPLNQTVAFKSYDDMVAAKTAVMKSMQDKVEAAAAKRNIKLTSEQKDYLMASGYNGGFGTATDLLDAYAAGDKNALSQGISKKKQVHNNIQQRLRWSKYISESKKK